MEAGTLKQTLTTLSPVGRLKFIRQKIIKKSQINFCEDGIIRIGTLKAVESEKIKIGLRSLTG